MVTSVLYMESEILMLCFLISHFFLYVLKKGSLCYSNTISQILNTFTFVLKWGFSEELSKVTSDPSKKKIGILLDCCQGTCLYFCFWLVLDLLFIAS